MGKKTPQVIWNRLYEQRVTADLICSSCSKAPTIKNSCTNQQTNDKNGNDLNIPKHNEEKKRQKHTRQSIPGSVSIGVVGINHKSKHGLKRWLDRFIHYRQGDEAVQHMSHFKPLCQWRPTEI